MHAYAATIASRRSSSAPKLRPSGPVNSFRTALRNTAAAKTRLPSTAGMATARFPRLPPNADWAPAPPPEIAASRKPTWETSAIAAAAGTNMRKLSRRNSHASRTQVMIGSLPAASAIQPSKGVLPLVQLTRSGNSGERRYRPRAYSKVTIWTFGRRQAGGWRVPSIRQRQED